MRSRTSGRAPSSDSAGRRTAGRQRLVALGSLALLGVGLAFPRLAAARVYPVPIVVDSEDDLRALYNDGLIEEGDFDTLLVLLDDPLDINRARRSDLYDLPGLSLDRVDALIAFRKAHGAFASVEALRQIDGFDDATMEQLYPFIKAVPVEPRFEGPKGKVPVRGRVRARTALPFEEVEPVTEENPNQSLTVEQLGYRYLPSSYVAAEAEAYRAYEVGVLGLMHNGVQAVAYNADSRDFYVDYGAVTEVGKIYAELHRVRLNAVVGSYSAGFGLGLTFDRTSRSNPQGLYTDLNVSGSDDFKVSRRLFGVGVRGFNIPVGPLSLDGTVFASSNRGDVYQYDIALAGGDEDANPYTDDLGSPRVYFDGQRMSYLTLPNMWRENLAGVNVTASKDDRTHVGVTAYVAHQDRTIVDGVESDYDWVLSDGWPTDPTYGAVGLNGAWGTGHVDLAAEVARSFGGGTGLLMQGVLSYPKTEVEATLRRYSAEFSNPYARGQANADTYEGQRDRDEQGARVKVESRINKQLGVRASADVWQNMTQGVWNADLYGRLSYSPTRDYDLMIYMQHRNRNLAVNGRTRVYGGDWEEEFYGDSVGDELTTSDQVSALDTDPTDRAGSREDIGGQVRVDKLPLTSISVFYKRYYEDAGLLYPNEGEPCYPWYEIGQYTWFKVRVKPTDNTAVTARLRYVDDDIYGSLGDRQAEGYLQVDQKLPKRVKVSLRGTLGRDLVDEAASWEDACDSGGEPELSGTCVVDASVDDTEIVRKKPYGAVWASAEVKF